MNIVIADDSALLREGVSGLLERNGHTVVARASDADTLISIINDLAAEGNLPDIVITDVRMPPLMGDDGLRAAVRLRADYPELSFIVLSQYVAPAYAVDLFTPTSGGSGGSGRSGVSGVSGRSGAGVGVGGTGYLLKDRVADVADFLRAIDVVANGGTIIDPAVANALMSAGRSGLAELTPREREVLELMSQGMSNSQIAAHLVVSGAAVAKHVSNIFLKLRLDPEEENRRVRAILQYLGAEMR
ncbi:response regulator transcription factor [Corynebacterium epidermidicanis]|uniref:Two component transcriptional regulator, LuxR family n=1 Tax=Corynebacterium epidermidicanis TaxID=1050174 RepID=A0A0G3GXR1_9CORY|nr:response regulator transcription factor [Corynebacterium epidermidicanis]AKK04318.1 two component transcriptional regulator, LuxR family [Corynebacterium epidermidicanis]